MPNQIPPLRLISGGLNSRSSVVADPAEWRLVRSFGGGYRRVWTAEDRQGRQGFAKLAFQGDGDVPFGAHEKIAAELASLVGVPVPKVVLWVNPNDNLKYSISEPAFQQYSTWEAEQGNLADTFIQNALPTLAAGFVFHAWIGDTDHGSNGSNYAIDLDSDDEKPRVKFIDHGNSLSSSWFPNLAQLRPLEDYIVPISSLPVYEKNVAALRISGLDSAQVKEIVNVIPSEFCSLRRSERIIDGLMRRQTVLTKVFDA